MSFGTRLRDKRKELGITQPELAKLLGVSQSAIGSWETDTNSPRATLLYDLFDILHCDANYLFQDETKALYKNEATPEEFENIIKKYRSLDAYGQETVSYILNREADRSKNLLSQADRIKELESDLYKTQNGKSAILRLYPYLHKIASAGNGSFYFDDLPTDTIQAPYVDGADFIIGVIGDSMKPTFEDGDLVYVQKCQIVEIGEIGIFILNNECYIKETGQEGLISHNPKYPIIPGTEDIQCIGKVLGKVSK